MDRIEALLKEFTEAPGVSGFEGEIFSLLERRLSPIATVGKDRLGSCIARLKGGAERPRVMLAAHMDEIGLLVKHITKDGYIQFIKVGGIDDRVLVFKPRPPASALDEQLRIRQLHPLS